MSSLTLKLPGHLSGSSLCRVVSEFIRGCPAGLPASVTLDFGSLRFIEPAGVTFLSNFISWLHHKSVRVLLANHTSGSEALRFLDDSLFFEGVLGSRLNAWASPRNTTKPLVNVHHDESHAWLRMELVPWLSGRLNLTAASLHQFQVCISEIFNNIKDHSSLEIGCIFVQHFPNLHRVNIAVADFGKGIPNAVRSVRPQMTDAEAIVQAVQEGFTTKSTPRNRGAGLDYLLQTVVGANGGSVSIFSLSAHVQFTRNGTSIESQSFADIGFCPGTTIDIQLRTDTIVSIQDEAEDLIW